MKVIHKKEWIQFESSFAEPELKVSPYWTERFSKDGEVIWFGHNTNWKRENGRWSKLEGSEFISCEEPIYETLYLKEKLK